MQKDHLKRVVVLLVVVCGLAALWPTLASARQNSYGFNQTWFILGPYYPKKGNYGANPGTTAIGRDFLTDGVTTQYNIVPTTGLVVLTNPALPTCYSYSFVWYTVQNGFDKPTVFHYDNPGDNATVDFKAVFNMNDNRLDNNMCYAFAFVNNLTASNQRYYFGVGSDDSIVVILNGVQLYANNTARGSGGANEVQNAPRPSTAWPLFPGLNLVGIKVFNGGGGYNFRCRVQTNGNTGTDNTNFCNPTTQARWELDKGSWVYPPLPPVIPGTPRADADRWIRTDLGYTPGSPTRVDVIVTTNTGSPFTRVREYPPSGWTIGTPVTTWGTATILTTTTIYGSPAWTGQYIDWDLGQLTTVTARMSYLVTPPMGTTGLGQTTGTVISDTWRMIGRNPWGNVQGREVLYFEPNPPAGGFFDWAGNVGLPPMGDNVGWTARQNHPPFSSGTAQRGEPWLLGNYSYAGGTYTVTGGGHDIWDNSDACYMLAKRVTGNFILKADILWTSTPGMPGLPAYRTDGTEWAKALIMVRNTIQSGSAHGNCGLRNYYQGNDFVEQWRDNAWGGCGDSGSDATNNDPNPPPAIITPITCRLVRRGSVVENFQLHGGVWERHSGSTGGHTVTQLTSPSVLACIAVGSHNNTTRAQAQFSNVSITPLPLSAATRSVYSVFPPQQAPFPNIPCYTSTSPITVKIFLKNGGGTGALLVQEYAPTSWTITSSNPVGVPNGNAIYWGLPAFNADTTLTYVMQPPLMPGSTTQAPIAPQFFGAGFANDQTNLLNTPIGGNSMVVHQNTMLYQRGRFPTGSYDGTRDAHPIWYNAGFANMYGFMNNGWNNEFEEGDWNGGTDDNKMGVIKFDIIGLSPAAEVKLASLSLYESQTRMGITSGTTQRIYAAKINRDWSEGCASVGGVDGRPSNLGEVNWWWAKCWQSPWAIGGIRGGAFDCDVPKAYVDASSYTAGSFLTWDITPYVMQWVSSPSQNFGVKLSQDDQNTTHYPFPNAAHPTWGPGYQQGVVTWGSSEWATVTQRPILAIYAPIRTVLQASHWELYR